MSTVTGKQGRRRIYLLSRANVNYFGEDGTVAGQMWVPRWTGQDGS